MKRLTADNEDGTAYYPHCFRDDTCGGMGEGNCGTCGFRQQVCQRLAEYERTGLDPSDIRKSLRMLYLKEFNRLYKTIEKLQLERMWIPVTERLSEGEGSVLVTDSYGRTDIGGYNDLDEGWYTLECGSNAEVIAWKPLPEPYQPQNLKEAGEDAAQSGLMPAT